jgi:dihydrolipoamide dehydrogenase
LATGSVPKQLKGFPWDGQKILNSNQALELESIPESLLIVGGGVIGCEFACLFSALGTQVVLVEALERLLPVPGIDEECSSLLLREMKKLTTKCYCNTSVNTWKDQGAHLEVELGPSPFTNDQSKTKDFSKSIVAEKILLCLGRSSQSHTLGLETIGIGTDDTGWVETDATLATTSKGVYAIGDLLGPSRMMLAHAAATEGRVAAENALGGSKTMDYRSIPSAIFTTPEVANTGLTEKQALDLGYQVDTSKVLFRTLGKAHAEAEIAGQGKIVSDQSTGKLLGAHLIGPRVTEYIGEMVLALNKGCTVNDLAEVVHPHPTFSEILGDLALKLVNT